MNTIHIQSKKREQLIDITHQIQSIVHNEKMEEGIVVLFVPHTTAAVTINENADPDVKRDMIVGLSRISPNHPDYYHMEGNSDAHIKSSLIGVDQTLLVKGSQLQLGTWQGIYFCEFDGPRTRSLHVSLLPSKKE